MNKYKVGDKVVLTVTSTNEMGCLPCYVLNDDLILSKQDIDKYTEPLTAYTEPLERKNENKQKQIEKLVDKLHRQAAEITRLLAENKELKEESKRNYTINIEMARAEGHSEAWELARKIAVIPKNGGYGGSKLIEIFNTALINEIFNLTYPEAAAKVAEWEKAKEEIKVGDVVSHEEKYGVVISEGTICFRGFTDDGTPFEWYKERCTKTGRHIDIDGFLKQIRGEE